MHFLKVVEELSRLWRNITGTQKEATLVAKVANRLVEERSKVFEMLTPIPVSS